MEHTQETIGPEEAQAFLDNLMPNYRPIDEEQVETYAKLMRQGAWKPEMVLHVDEELGLVNGRRVLVAVVRAKVEVEFTVALGKYDFLREQG